MSVDGVASIASIGIGLATSPPSAWALSVAVPANIEPVISAGNVIVTQETP